MNITRLTVLTVNGECEYEPSALTFENTKEAAIGSVKINTDAALLPDCAVKIVFCSECEDWMAIEHHSGFWCRPAFGKKFSELPKRVQLLLIKKSGGYLALLPLCGNGYTSFLTKCDSQIQLNVFSLCDDLYECATPCIAYSEADNPYKAIENVCKAAAKLYGIKLRGERKYPEIFEYLGWCSWDAMEIWINEQGVKDKCCELRDKNVPIYWAILDDMWADIAWEKELPPFTPHGVSFGVMHRSKMRDYKADPVRFPQGLEACISSMKKDGFHVGIWHPVTGYWAGLQKNGKAYEKLQESLFTNENGLILPDFRDENKAENFFSTMHEYFEDCGAEFVKIDNQSCLRDRFRGVAPIENLAKNMHTAIENSVNSHFDGRIINCMGMASENMFSRSSAVSRCSDDFQPENRQWFSKHLLQCTFNGLLQGQFYVNDFDMWWTDDSQARKNSLLRAVSGGPIYVSDRQDRTVKEILDPLCFSDGRICRCENSAKPMNENLFGDPTKKNLAFCVENSCNGAEIVAAFNINEQNERVFGSISISELGFEHDCVIWNYFGNYAEEIGKDGHFDFELENNDSVALFIIKRKEAGITVFGLADKFISPASAVSENAESVQLYEDGKVAWFDGTLHITESKNRIFMKI